MGTLGVLMPDALTFRLIGHGIAYSASPAMMNAAFGALGLPHRYELADVPAEGVGEVVATAAVAAGSHAGGGTTRAMVWAMLGGIVGGIVLTPVIPIPLVGTLIGAMIGTFGGALAGEMTGDARAGGSDSVRAAAGATFGRLLGSMGKTLVAAVVWVVLSIRLFSA